MNIQIDFTKLKPCSYTRKSSESEDKQVLSIISQTEEAGRIATYYNLPQFIEVFQESKSAKTENARPAFLKMISLIRNGVIDSIVCWKLDRLARNMTEGGILIDLLSSGRLKAILTHDKVYYPSDNVLLMSVEFGQGKQFIKDLSVNVKRGQIKKASMGIPHGVAALGFKNDRTEEKGNRKWLVDEERLWKVQKLFGLFLRGQYSGCTLHKYALRELGLTTPKHKRIGGKLISRSKMYTTLKDPMYAGFFYYNHERYELDTTLPRIITETEHQRVLQLLSGRTKPKIQHHTSLYAGFIRSAEGDFIGQDVKCQLICDCRHKFAYRSKIFCPKCNQRIEELNTPRYLIKSYYYNVKKKKACIPYKSIEESKITKEINAHFTENLALPNELIEWSRKHITELKDKEVAENLVIQKDRTQQQGEFEKKKRRLRELLRDEQITEKEYSEDVALLTAKYGSASNKNVDWYQELMNITDLMKEMKEVMENGTIESRRAILSKLGSNLIWDDKKLNVYGLKSIETLIEGIKSLRHKYDQFEPEKNLMPQGQKGLSEEYCTALLRTWDNVRQVIIRDSSINNKEVSI